MLPDYDRIGRLLAAHDAIALYLAAVDPEAGTARARSFLRTAEMGEDPATGVGRRPAGRARGRAARASSASRSTRAWRWAGRAGWSPALDGDRVRVGGDAVILAEGTVHLLDT